MSATTAAPITSHAQRKRSAAEQFVVLQLAGQAYGLPLEAAREIVPMAALWQPPGLPPVLAGFLNLHGVAIPVLKLARLFGLAEQPTGLYTPLVIVRTGGSVLALLVDAIQGLATIAAESLAPVPENLCFNDCAIGLVSVGDATVVLVSPDRLLRAEERFRFQQLAAIEQARLADLQEVCP